MSQVNIRIDDSLKEKGEQLFHSLGLSFSAAVSAFVSQAVREGGMPFAITTNENLFYGGRYERRFPCPDPISFPGDLEKKIESL